MGKVIRFKEVECADTTHAKDYTDKVVLKSVGTVIDNVGFLFVQMADGCYELDRYGSDHVDDSDWQEAADWFGELSPHDWDIVKKHLSPILLTQAQEYRTLCTPLIWNCLLYTSPSPRD